MNIHPELPSQPVASTSSSDTAARADDLLVQRFQEVMRAPSDAVAADNARLATPAPPLSSASGSLGDSILSSVTQWTTQLRDSWDRVGEGVGILDKPDLPSYRELLALQFETQSMVVASDIMSKAVSKATQDLDQLLKTQ